MDLRAEGAARGQGRDRAHVQSRRGPAGTWYVATQSAFMAPAAQPRPSAMQVSPALAEFQSSEGQGSALFVASAACALVLSGVAARALSVGRRASSITMRAVPITMRA